MSETQTAASSLDQLQRDVDSLRTGNRNLSQQVSELLDEVRRLNAYVPDEDDPLDRLLSAVGQMLHETPDERLAIGRHRESIRGALRDFYAHQRTAGLSHDPSP